MESLKNNSFGYENLEKLAGETKNKNIDNYKIGNYCDALDETKNFCVGEIIDRQNDQIKVHFEGWSNKHDIIVVLGKTKKVDNFRKNTKGYTGQKVTAYRTLSFLKEEFLNFKKLIKELKGFFCHSDKECILNYFSDASEVTQLLRGKIFFKLDYFMTNPFSNMNQKEMVAEVVEILYDYLDMIVGFLKYYKDNISYTEINRKFTDLFMFDKNSALLASLYEILATLKRIFGRDERVNFFYKSHFDSLKDLKFRDNKSKICKKKYYLNMQQDRLATFAIVNYIDYFNELHGIRLIFEILLSQNESLIPNSKLFHLSLEYVQYYLELLENISFFVNIREYFGKEINALKENIWNRVSNLSEIEIKEIEKNTIEKIARHIKNILDPEDKTLIFDELCLNFHLKCFTSKSLPKRIKGITEINGIIQRLETKEKGSQITNSDLKDQYEEYRIDIQNLFEWIKKSNFIEIFFGENIHEEMLKRCIPILTLYCRNNSLDNKFFDILWKLSEEKHEAISQQIQNIFIELSRNLKKTERDYIYNKIVNNPKNRFDSEMLNFAKNFSLNCIVFQNFEKNKKNIIRTDNNDYGINLFIRFSMDEVDNEKNDINTIDSSIDYLKELFSKIEFNDEMINCLIYDLVERMKRGYSIIQCMKIIGNIISAIPDTTYNNEKKYNFLHTKFSLLDLIIEDLKRYILKSLKIRYCLKNNIQISEIQNTSINSLNNQEIANNFYEGFYNHKTNIELRLNFIKYIYPLLKEFSDKDLNYHISNLWDIFFDMDFYNTSILLDLNINSEAEFENSSKMLIDNLDEKNVLQKKSNSDISLTEYEQNLFFQIFNNNVDNSTCRFSIVSGKYLFKNILINEKKFNPRQINLNAFKIFTKFFYFINISEKKVINVRGKFIIQENDLNGHDFIWKILVNTPNIEVRMEAANLIVNNTLNLINYTPDFCNKIWSNFISKLLFYFTDSMEKYANEKTLQMETNHTEGIKGLLLMIRKLLDKIDEQYIPLQEDVYFAEIGHEVQFKISGKNSPKVLKIDKNELIFDVRSKISYIYDIPMINVGFKNLRRNSIISCNDDYTLAFDLIDRNSTLEIIQINNPILKINENPKNLILENKYIFDKLFDILENQDCEFINDAWELINIMPKNKELEIKITELGNKIYLNPEVEFLQCFDIESLYHLSYSLQILKNLFMKFSNNNNMIKWMENFRKNKALHFFVKVLSEIKRNKNIFSQKMTIEEYEAKLTFSTFYLNLIFDLLFIIQKINEISFEKNQKDHNDTLLKSSQSTTNTTKSNDSNHNENSNLFMASCETDENNIQDRFIQNLFRIIYEILIASYNTDNLSKYRELQAEFIKKKTKELMMKNYNNKTDEIIDLLHPDMEHIHDEIRLMWIQEDKVISEICKFLENINNFPQENIIRNILSYGSGNQEKGRNSNIVNYFSLIIKKGLVIPKNFKAKLSIWEFFEKLLLSNNQEININKNLFFCYIYNNIFSNETLLYCVNHSESLNSFSNIVMKILSYNLITQEFLEKNKSSLALDFKEVLEYILSLIDNIDKHKINSNVHNLDKSLSEDKLNDDDALEYLFSLLREFTLNNQDMKNHLLNSRDMLKYIINDCLFSKCIINVKNPVEVMNTKDEDMKNKSNKFLNNNSKSAAFGLLSSLSYDNNSYIKQLCEIFLEYHKLGFWRSKRLIEWNKFASADQKSQTGFVGLENLGCTCYMNSLLQQFFNIDFIREGVLACSDNPHFPTEESYLYQIKTIFAFLKATDRKFHNPKDFTSIFKNYDGQVMNVAEQMDVDEFYNLLIDRLEPYLKSTKFENLFKFTFSGKISNEIIGRSGCPHHSETKEVFQSIILQVKNKKNIEESLDAFIQGEMMEGENSYSCERCEKKVSALKRQCIKELPRVLVLVLKRFEYDYDTMQKNKINDYCEFPLELNMEKYTQQYLMKKNNEKNENNEDNSEKKEENSNKYDFSYDLTGVIIHTGTTERGHYYSFVRKESKNWYEFNDTNVSNFNIEDLEDEAYGGSQYFFNNKTGKNELLEKSSNAYVLFYTRKDVLKDEEEIKNCMDIETKHENESFVFLNLLKDINKYSNIQQNIIDIIKTDNFQYWVSKTIFSVEYINFVKDIMLNYNSEFSEIYNKQIFAKTSFYNFEAIENIFEELEKIYDKSTKSIKNPSKGLNGSNIKNSVNLLNYGNSLKQEKYDFENVRVHRFKKTYLQNKNFSNNPNVQNEITQSDLECYLNKISEIYQKNSNIKTNQIISNVKRIKRATCLNSKKETSISNKSSNSINVIPEESEIQIPSEIYIKENKLSELVSSLQKDYLSLMLFKFGVIFFFTTIIRLREKNSIGAFVDIIKTNININIINAVWILEEFSNVDLISEFLVDCPQIEMRRVTAGILFCALLKVSNDEEKYVKKSVNVNEINSDYVIISQKDVGLNDNIMNVEISKEINESNKMETVYNFIGTLLNLTSRKTKFLNKDFQNLYYLIWRFASIGIKQKEYLINSGLIKFIVATFKSRNKLKCEINPEECFKIEIRPPRNSELKNKIPLKNEKLTMWEELMEKKQSERMGVGSDNYLTLAFFEILSSSDYPKLFQSNEGGNGADINIENNDKMQIEKDISNIEKEDVKSINLSEMIVKLISIEDKEHFKMYANEASKFRLGSVYFSNLINKFSFNNEKFSNKIFEAFYENFNALDADELLPFIKPFRGFISLHDDLAEIRMKKYFKNYMTLITGNFGFFKYVELNIENIIQIFLNQANMKRFLGQIDKYKELIMKFYKWIKANPISPQYCNTKDTVLYKKRPTPTPNLSAAELQQYQNAYTKLSEENATKLQKIYTANLKDLSEIQRNSHDMYKHDYIDFEFLIGDVVRFELNRSECKVLSVMDELVLLEYTSDSNIQKKPITICKWIEVEKINEIVSLSDN